MTAKNQGEIRLEDNPQEFFETPAWAVRALVNSVFTKRMPLLGGPDRLAIPILEPCAGNGAILRALIGCGAKAGLMRAIEIDEGRVRECRALRVGTYHGNALTSANLEWRSFPRLVIMNPPFSLAVPFLERALEATEGRQAWVAALLPQNFLGSGERAVFHRRHPCSWFQLTSRPSFCVSLKCKERPRRKGDEGCTWRATQSPDLPRPTQCPACSGGVDVVTTDAMDYGWAVYGPGYGNELHWIDKPKGDEQ